MLRRGRRCGGEWSILAQLRPELLPPRCDRLGGAFNLKFAGASIRSDSDACVAHDAASRSIPAQPATDATKMMAQLYARSESQSIKLIEIITAVKRAIPVRAGTYSNNDNNIALYVMLLHGISVDIKW